MSWHYSRELVEGCMAASSLAGAADVLWKLIPMPEAFSSHVRMMELFPFSQFGMTYVHLTDELGEELLTWFLEGFRVRTSQSQDKEAALNVANEAVCGENTPELLTKCDPVSSSLKTARCWQVEDCISSCETLPASGTMRNGVCYPREIAVLPTYESECGFSQYLTPTATDGGVCC